jgi:hypothetical protein
MAQMQKTDSIGNFYVIDNHLMWQKYYSLDDVNELDEHLKNNHFTSTLDILNYKTSSQSNLSYIEGNNLPQYTNEGFKAFIIIDIIQDRVRVTVRDIIFPKYIQTAYYNGFKDQRGGTLDHYILRTADHEIKRNSGTYNILDTFDNSFEAVFNLNGE